MTGSLPRPGTDHIYSPEVVSANAIHFINIGDARDAIPVGLAPYGFRLRLYTGYSTEK